MSFNYDLMLRHTFNRSLRRGPKTERGPNTEMGSARKC